jgi:hypothetical protein
VLDALVQGVPVEAGAELGAVVAHEMRRSNALNSADPVHLGAQIVLLGVAEPIGIEAVLAAPNGGYLRS